MVFRSFYGSSEPDTPPHLDSIPSKPVRPRGCRSAQPRPLQDRPAPGRWQVVGDWRPQSAATNSTIRLTLGYFRWILLAARPTRRLGRPDESPPVDPQRRSRPALRPRRLCHRRHDGRRNAGPHAIARRQVLRITAMVLEPTAVPRARHFCCAAKSYCQGWTLPADRRACAHGR